MRVTHGCVRLYPEDVAWLFGDVPTGTSVRIVHQPYKLGRTGDEWYLESHPPFIDTHDPDRDDLEPLIDALYELMNGPYGGQVDNRAAFTAARKPSGSPEPVSSGN